MFRFDRSKISAHFETFSKFFTVEVFAGLIIFAATYLWITVVGGESNLVNLRYKVKDILNPPPGSGRTVAILLDEREYSRLKSGRAHPYDRADVQEDRFPRVYLAKLLKEVKRCNPSLIVLDVLLDLPSRNPSSDSILSATLRQMGDIVLPAQMRQGRLISPMGIFIDSTRHALGYSELISEDGYIRKVQLLSRSNLAFIPSLSFAAYLHSTGKRTIIDQQRYLHALLSGAENIPLSIKPTALLSPQLIQFSGLREKKLSLLGSKRIRVYRSSDVLAGLIPKGWLEGKVIFIGGTYGGKFTDLMRIPAAGDYLIGQRDRISGVLIHAAIFESLTTDNLIHNINPYLFLAGVLSLLILSLLLFLRFHLKIALAFLSILILGYWLWGFYSFIYRSQYLPISFPTIFSFFNILLLIFLHHYRAETKVDLLNRIWGAYVPEGRLNFILKGKRKGQIEPSMLGKTERITLLYIRFLGLDDAFKLAEEALPDPSETHLRRLRILDRLISLLQTEVVFLPRFLGAAERFIGDAIYFYFGIPVGEKDEVEALRGVNCALALQEKFRSLRSSWPDLKRHFPNLALGFHLHVGKILIGTVHDVRGEMIPTFITKLFSEVQQYSQSIPPDLQKNRIFLTPPLYHFISDHVEVQQHLLNQNTVCYELIACHRPLL